MCKKINYYILSFQNFWSQNTKTIKKLIKCTSGRISSTTYPDGLKNTLDDKKKKIRSYENKSIQVLMRKTKTKVHFDKIILTPQRNC